MFRLRRISRAFPGFLSAFALLAASATSRDVSGAGPALSLSGASWIWPQANSPDREVAYFRRAFEIDGKVRSARIAASCDNELRVFLNGRPVLQSGTWERPVVADATKLLRPGANLIAVRGANQGGPAALIVKLEIQLEGDRRLTVQTDATWLASSEMTRGWRRPSFRPQG